MKSDISVLSWDDIPISRQFRRKFLPVDLAIVKTSRCCLARFLVRWALTPRQPWSIRACERSSTRGSPRRLRSITSLCGPRSTARRIGWIQRSVISGAGWMVITIPHTNEDLCYAMVLTVWKDIPTPASGAGSIEIVESYNGESSRSAVSLEVTKTYHGMEADQMRYSLSSLSPADLSKSHLNYYADNTPSITANGLPIIEDDQKTNTIVIKEKYLITELWKDNRHSFVADRIYNELRKPRVSQRTVSASRLSIHSQSNKPF